MAQTRKLPLLFVSLLLIGCGGGGEDAGREPSSGARDLIESAAAGDLAAVRRALDAAADVDARDESGRTAVTAAAAGEHVEVVRALIDAGLTSTSRTRTATTRCC